MSLLSHWEGEAVQLWRGLWGLPYLEIHEVLGSTNERIRELARDGSPPWSLVIAEAQTGGKGRGGKSWFSLSGGGLLFSLLLSSRGTEWDSLLPLRVGMAGARAVDGLLQEEGMEPRSTLGLKWPNDWVLAERKVGGILCERGGQDWVVVGIGVNVHQAPLDFPPELRGIAGSLEGASGARVSRGRLMSGILGELRGWLTRDEGRLDDEEMLEYSRRDTLMGRRVETEVHGMGIARGITSEGSLRLEKGGGVIVEVRAGSVKRT